MVLFSPIDAKVDRRALVTRSKEPLSRFIASTDRVQVVQIVQNDVMKPQTGICICVCPVRKLESSFHVGDGAILASKCNAWVFEVFHAVVDVHRRHNKRAVCDFHSLRALVGEELRCKCGDG